MANCLKSIKSCLNSMKQNKDYEFVSYEQQQQQTPEINRNMNVIDPIRPIEYSKIETNNFELKKQKAKINLMNQQPQFQSTRIIENTINDYSSLYFTPCNKNNKAVSSTMINTNDSSSSSLLTNDLTTSQIETTYYDSFTNSLYFLPQQNNSLISSDESSQDTFDESQSFNSIDSNQFHSVKSSFFNDKQEEEENEEIIFVCTIPYQAKFQGDLNTNYLDRVKLIHSNKDYCLVQNISTKQCGYIPKISIILLSNFLNQF
jgi:hypothetical protein